MIINNNEKQLNKQNFEKQLNKQNFEKQLNKQNLLPLFMSWFIMLYMCMHFHIYSIFILDEAGYIRLGLIKDA